MKSAINNGQTRSLLIKQSGQGEITTISTLFPFEPTYICFGCLQQESAIEHGFKISLNWAKFH